MDRRQTRIQDSSSIAIAGGGPAGSFLALFLLRYCRVAGFSPRVTIYQDRDFTQPGPKGCKGCAGILSARALAGLGELGLGLPQELVQSRIEHYTVHSPHVDISISKPDKAGEITSIYRGAGPRLGHGQNPQGFDGWLLHQAQLAGAVVVPARVSAIRLGGETAVQVDEEWLPCDVAVLATGSAVKPPTISGLAYVRPKTQAMAQDELYAGEEQVTASLGNAAHAFLVPHSGMVFGTLVPKGPFINVSVLSRRHPVSVTDFLNYDIVRRVLPEHFERCCGCRPRTAVGPAANYFGDGFVAVGEAAVSRLYKDGIGSALLTARAAARTIVEHGFSHDDFRRHYQPFCRTIEGDNRRGRLLFAINDRAKNSRSFLLAQHRLISDEQSNTSGPQPFTRIVWGMFTGAYSYGSMTGMAFNPVSLARLSFNMAREAAHGPFHKEGDFPRQLQVRDKKVVILGSGFGGTYALRHLVRGLNRNESIQTTMVSNENFFLFAPLLHEVAVGRIEGNHIAYPIRRLHHRDRFTFAQATVQKIDLAERKVLTSHGDFGFDYLVLALGTVTNMSSLHIAENAGENVFTLKSLQDSVLLRDHIIEVFEKACAETDPDTQRQWLTFVVCGGGYTGIQLIAELRDFISRSLPRYYKSIDKGSIRIILVEAERKIVADLHTKLGRYIMDHLLQAGIEVRLTSRVTQVWSDRIEINHEETVPCGTLVWAAGVVAHPLVSELPVEKDSLGRAHVNEYMELPGQPGVYVVGDCAHFEDPKVKGAVPPLAHIAVRQARVVAHNILADIRGRDKTPYRYSANTQLVSLGSRKAVFRYRGLRLYGFPARLIWLAGYSTLVTGKYNRVRILMDWTLGRLFGRDTTHLRLKK